VTTVSIQKGFIEMSSQKRAEPSVVQMESRKTKGVEFEREMRASKWNSQF
jgi:hypothetical protein